MFFHGNAQNRSSHFFALYWILHENYDFFIFDYPGYADSEGSASRSSTTDAGTKALEWLNGQNPSVPLIVFGQSLGGNIAMYTVVQNKLKIPVCLVAVDSTFKSYRKIAQRIMANAWVLWPFQGLSYIFIGDSYSADKHISEIAPIPLIVFHGENDPVVAYQNGVDVFDAASEPKKFFKVPGSGHTMAFNGPNQEEFRKAFLEELQQNCRVKKNSP